MGGSDSDSSDSYISLSANKKKKKPVTTSKKNTNNNKMKSRDSDDDNSSNDNNNNNNNNNSKGNSKKDKDKDNSKKTNKDKDKDNSKKKKDDTVDTTDWKKNPAHVSTLLKIFQKHCDPYAKMQKKGWEKAVKEFKKGTDKNYPKQVLQSKMAELKALYSKFEKLKAESGMGWNEAEKTVTASDIRWAELLDADPSLASFRSKGLPDYDVLHEIFMSKTATGKHAQGGVEVDKVDDDEDDDDDDDQDNDDNTTKKRKREPKKKRNHSETPSIAAKKEQTEAINNLSAAMKYDPVENKKEKAKELLNAYLKSFRTPLPSRLSLKLKQGQISDYEVVETLEEDEIDEWALNVCRNDDELVAAIAKKKEEIDALKISRKFFSSCKFKLKSKAMEVIENIVLDNADIISNFTDREQFSRWAIDETTAADAIRAEQVDDE